MKKIFTFLLTILLLNIIVFGFENNISSQIYINKATMLFKKASQTNNLNDLKKSYNILLEASKKYPNNLMIKLLMYDIGLSYIKLKYDSKIANYIKSLYNTALMINPLRAASPSFIDSLKVNDINKKIVLLKKALKENRYFTDSYLYLATFYMNKKYYDMAIVTLKMALKYEKDKQSRYLINKTLISIYLEKFFNLKDECIATNKSFLKSVINLLKESIKLNPKDSNSYDLLATFYSYLGQNQLAIFNAKKAIEFAPNNKDLLVGYEYILIASGNVDKFFKINKSNHNGNMALAYLVIQDWQNASIYLKNRLKTKPKHFYTHLKYALSNAMIDRKKDILKTYLLNLQKDVTLNSWEENIKDFFIGKIDKKELLKRVKDKCQKSEALFYIGFNYLLKGDNNLAKKYFKKVVNLKVYSYIEYILSKYYLQLLKK